MKSVKLSDLDWDFSEGNEVELKIGNKILVISRGELEDFIESWNENLEEQRLIKVVCIFKYNKKISYDSKRID